MVNLTMVVADGAGRWDTTTLGYRHNSRLYTFSARTHARSLAPFSSTRFPAHTIIRSAILFLVYFGRLLRSAFFYFLFHSTGWILRSRRFRSTRLIFISFPISRI